MINGINLNSKTTIHKNLLTTTKMTDTKSNLQPNNTFSTFATNLGTDNNREGSNCYATKSSNMTLNDLKSGQYMQAHVRLQNNGWNYQNFCRLYTNNNNNNNNKNNNYNKNLIQSQTGTKTSEMTIQDVDKSNKQRIPIAIQNQNQNPALITITPLKRNEDQENAFRRIEDVHNYAKLKHAFSESASGESSRSSPHDDEDEEEDAEREGEEAEDSTDTVDLEEKDKDIRTDIDYMSHFKYLKKYRLLKHQQQQQQQQQHDEDMHIDVETVPYEEEMYTNSEYHSKKDMEISSLETEIPPDHHARRPMNAFLIFCKRHRAIVKDRYKTLENRAITKILGDWWASLDGSDKQCFTNLAQENKDAFFSANPNFKWYKLPAPPLRTVRANSGDNLNEYSQMSLRDECRMDEMQNNNIFKFADEAHMGDLNALLMHNEKRKKMKNNQAALQQVLGETTQFFNKHMQSVKRTYNDCNMINGEDEILPKKTSRSCKGKKYQELMQSGQIAAIVKKTKVTTSLPKTVAYQQQQQHQEKQQQLQERQQQQLHNQPHSDELNGEIDELKNQNHQEASNLGNKRMENSKVFDLEEKIKELPSLNLDAYLQRKRNVKKKRKINAKKSNNSSHLITKKLSDELIVENVNNNNNNNNTTTITNITTTSINDKNTITYNNNNNNNIATQDRNSVRTAVGSQKRKARKESITRRDVSSIENDVTAVLPMSNVEYSSIKSNYYYDESNQVATTYAREMFTKSANTSLVAPSSLLNTSNLLLFNNSINNCNKAISPTSDLLILAEVAEKTSCF